MTPRDFVDMPTADQRLLLPVAVPECMNRGSLGAQSESSIMRVSFSSFLEGIIALATAIFGNIAKISSVVWYQPIIIIIHGININAIRLILSHVVRTLGSMCRLPALSPSLSVGNIGLNPSACAAATIHQSCPTRASGSSTQSYPARGSSTRESHVSSSTFLSQSCWPPSHMACSRHCSACSCARSGERP